jgi:hypothetical protein
MSRLAVSIVIAATLAASCTPKPPPLQTALGGQPIDLQELTPAVVAHEVQVVPRGQQIFFQAPPIQTTKVVDLRRAGEEMGISLGKVERVRFGYLFGVLDRPSGALRSYVLFQSNFIEGTGRYAAVSTSAGMPLEFTVSRALDPCVPNCFPVIEALIVTLPDPVLRAAATNGLGLAITLSDGQVIRTQAVPAYVAGYLQAVDGYQRN